MVLFERRRRPLVNPSLHSTRLNKLPAGASFRLLSGLICLFTYAFAATSLLGWMVAGLGALGGGHLVRLQAADRGLIVTFAHDATDPVRSLRHTHGLLDRSLVFFASSEASQPDHVFFFQAASGMATTDEKSEFQAGVPDDSPADVTLRAGAPSRVENSPAPGALFCPALPFAACVVRTTVLLI